MHKQNNFIFIQAHSTHEVLFWPYIASNLPAHSVNTANTATTPNAPLNDRAFENTMFQSTSDNSKIIMKD